MKGFRIVAGVGLLFSIGCSDAQDAPATEAAHSFVAGTRVRVMPKSDHRVAFAPGNPNLQYFGGHVIPNVKVIAVMWGSGVDSTTTSQIGDFYTTVTDSPYMDWLQEYDTNLTAVTGDPGTNQHIGRGTFGGLVTITPSTSATTIDDSLVQTELNAQIGAGNLPAPDANTLYMTYFPPGVTITQGGSASCQAFCAYHGTFVRNNKSTYYGVMPDMGGNCAQGCGNDTQFGNLTSASTHEMIEAVTDAEVGIAQGNGPPLAWYDNQYGEIGDICANYNDTVGGYTVQQEWSNVVGNCITSNASVPTPTPTQPPPTPTPSSTPGGGGHHGLLPGNVGGCSIGALGGTNGAMVSMFLLGALAFAAKRRRTN